MAYKQKSSGLPFKELGSTPAKFGAEAQRMKKFQEDTGKPKEEKSSASTKSNNTSGTTLGMGNTGIS
jgi:hypothetical protein